MDYCQGSSQIQLTAPNGFQTYNWSPGGATTQSINITSPNNNQLYTCNMATFSNQGNCQVTVSTQLTPTIVSANFNHTTGCTFVPIQFNTTSTGWNYTLNTKSSGTIVVIVQLLDGTALRLLEYEIE